MSFEVTPPQAGSGLIAWLKENAPDVYNGLMNNVQDGPRNFKDSHYRKKFPGIAGDQTRVLVDPNA